MNTKFADYRLRAFVLDVVNAEDRQVDGSDDGLFRKYEDFFPTRERDIQLLFMAPTHLKQARGDLWLGDLVQLQGRALLGALRDSLRAVWRAEFDDVAEWRIFTLRRRMYFALDVGDKKDKRLHPPAFRKPVQQAISWVRTKILLLRICRNPECHRPFFVAELGQERWCPKCVPIAKKADKRRWWRKNKGRQPEERVKTGGKIVENKRTRVLGMPFERLKRFLHHVVNASENRFDYILRSYADFFPTQTQTERLVNRRLLDSALLTQERLEPIKQHEARQAVKELREGLRSVWNTHPEDAARWRLFAVQNEVHRVTDPEHCGGDEELQPPSAERPIHAALLYLERHLHMLRECSYPGCQTPFFIAERPERTYCSDVCTWAAQKRPRERRTVDHPNRIRMPRHRPKESRRPS